jgi:zinc transporter 7
LNCVKVMVTLDRNTFIAATVSTGLISIAPNIVLFLFPDVNHGSGNNVMISLGQALAAGALLGDVFLHSLPELYGSSGANSDCIGLWIVLGFVVFLLMDVLVRSTEHHDHNHDQPVQKSNCKDGNKRGKETFIFSSAVVLNLTADSLHNFTDGFTIGASYVAFAMENINKGSWSDMIISRGGLATLSVLCHELPHELGDFAILTGAGMSKYQAILAQFSTAIAALLGNFVGLWVASDESSNNHLLLTSFTAGGFIYLSCVTLLPQILSSPRHEDSYWKAKILNIFAFAVGLAFMYLVASMEEGHEHHFHGHGHGHEHEHGHEHGHHEL